MNKSDLIRELKAKSEINKNEAERVVDTFFEAVANSLEQEERVEIRGFGSFTVKTYDPYVGRNPKTGEKIEVPAKRLPFFKVGKELKEMADYKKK